jgi:hypothetical protein
MDDKVKWIRITSVGLDEKEGSYLDIGVKKYDEVEAAMVATKIVELIENGNVPVDNWQPYIKVKPMSEEQPSIEFYLLVSEQVEGTPLDV